MSKRTNITNTSGIQTVSGGNMPANIATNAYVPTSRASKAAAAVVVVANSHPVEIGGDGGLWDTTSGVAVDVNQTNLLCIGT
jgi:hypothetical protein